MNREIEVINSTISTIRIFFSDDNSEALLLYADCLYRANRKEECYGLLRSEKLSGARLYYLFARVAFDLNK